MKKSDFIRLHMDLSICIPKTADCNPLPSDTDPTQDIPIKNIQLAANGLPINVKQTKAVYSNIKVENFTAIEKRNTDVFDAYGEMQSAVSNVSKKGVTTNYVKPSKKQKNED